MDYYDLLQVSRDASLAEIKKSFHKLAIKYHPDKNKNDLQAEETFCKIKEAYEVLCDPEKRQNYDKFGSASVQNDPTPQAHSSPSSHPSNGDPLSQFFGRRNALRTKDMVHLLNVTLEELYTGCFKKVNVTRRVICNICAGIGTRNGRKPVRCVTCNGLGRRMWQQGPQFMPNPHMATTQVLCETCNGTGEVIQQSDKCLACGGTKTLEEKKTMKIEIEKGMAEGKRIVFSGGSHEEPGRTTGDLIFVVKEKPHSIFKREGDDLIYTTDLQLVSALTGFTFPLRHLDGKNLYITMSRGDILRPGESREIHEKGMPVHGKFRQFGSLIINFNIIFPSSLKPEEMDFEPLNERSKTRKVDDQEIILQNIDPNSFKEERGKSKNAYEGDAPTQGEVQCQQQ